MRIPRRAYFTSANQCALTIKLLGAFFKFPTYHEIKLFSGIAARGIWYFVFRMYFRGEIVSNDDSQIKQLFIIEAIRIPAVFYTFYALSKALLLMLILLYVK